MLFDLIFTLDLLNSYLLVNLDILRYVDVTIRPAPKFALVKLVDVIEFFFRELTVKALRGVLIISYLARVIVSCLRKFGDILFYQLP